MPTHSERIANHVANARAARGDGHLNVSPNFNPRHCDWGHWGITFWTHDIAHMRGDWDTYNPGRMVAEIGFAVGNCGPVDGTLGSPTREHYRKLCREWRELGLKPVDFRNHPIRESR